MCTATTYHHKHPHEFGETLCSNPITDETLISHNDDEVNCDSCLLFARRGYDMFGKAVPFSEQNDSEKTITDVHGLEENPMCDNNKAVRCEQLSLFDTVQPSPAQETDNASLFSAADVIHVYTRAQAIEDGVLVDVTEIAKEAGFVWPVAVTAGVWALINSIPPRFEGIQDVEGRLWDVIWSASRVAKRGGGTETLYDLILHNGRKTYATLKLVSGPGDEWEPVITIMLPDED